MSRCNLVPVALFILNTGRSLSQGMYMESEGKWSENYFKTVVAVEMNPNDIKRLGVKDRVKIARNGSSLVALVKPSDRVPEGAIFIPMGPVANFIIDGDTDGIGIPSFKAIEVEASPAEEPVATLRDILKSLGAKNLDVDALMKDIPVQSGEKRVVESVSCPFCGDLCDYLKIEVDGSKIVRNVGGCAVSIAKFLNYHKHRVLEPYVRRGGSLTKVDLDTAIEEAAKILVNARYALIYGLSNTCVEAIELAVELAEILRGVVDNTSTVCHGPTVLAIQEVGTVAMTFAPVLHLADVVVFWGSNAREAHVNHVSRLVMAMGRFRKGRKDRKLVVVDSRKTMLADMADIFIQVEPGKDLELATALRMALRDLEIESPSVAGVPREKIYELAELMKTARYGALFFGMGVTHTGAKLRNIQAVIKLVQELNEWTKWVLLPMRGHYNVTGANQVSLWLTGYPYAVDFSRGFPRMIPGVTTAVDLLANGDVDAALIIASDPAAHFPRKAVEHLSKIPVIVIDAKWSLTTAFADVIIPAGLVGIECEGTAYRMDGVAIYMKKVVNPPPGVLCDVELLKRLTEKVKSMKGWGE
jgi:formylmethanofuran dehydrogenase subunit B